MLRISLLVLLLCLLVIPAAADQVTLIPVQDAFVCNCMPNTTNPMLGNQYLAQGRYSSAHNRSFIEWDLGSIPEGSAIDNVEFRIYCAQFYGSPSGQMVYFRVTESWNENSVTYNNMPSYTADGAIYTSSWPSTGTWHSIDITEFVSLWFNESVNNYGIYCHSTGCTGTCDCAFYSSNIGNPSYRPRIIVTYTPPSGFDENTWGEIKASD